MTEQFPPAASELPDRGGPIPTFRVPGWDEALGLVAGITGAGAPDADFGLDAPLTAGGTIERWRALQQQLGRFGGVALSRQVHETRVAVHHGPIDGVLIQYGYDGHITTVPGLLLSVTVADCVPLYLADSRRRAWGILHAGWRGVAAGIVETGISLLCDVASCSANEIVIHCGVSVCGSCYEVGQEVVQAVLDREAAAPELLDLRNAIGVRARTAGVARMTASDYCTIHGGARFHSHRRSGGAAGRMAAFIGLPA